MSKRAIREERITANFASSVTEARAFFSSANAGIGACLVMAEEMQGCIRTDKAAFLTFQADGGIMD